MYSFHNCIGLWVCYAYEDARYCVVIGNNSFEVDKNSLPLSNLYVLRRKYLDLISTKVICVVLKRKCFYPARSWVYHEYLLQLNGHPCLSFHSLCLQIRENVLLLNYITEQSLSFSLAISIRDLSLCWNLIIVIKTSEMKNIFFVSDEVCT